MSRWDSHTFTPAASTRVHAAALGPRDAPEVVCVHGLGCSYRYWLPFARALAPHARTVAPDLPGFGRTRGPRRALGIRQLSLALADWLRATGRGPTVLVANSIGCQIVVDLAVHAPELVGPVVLDGPTFDRRARSLWIQTARLLRDIPWERPALWPPLLTSYAECGPRRALRTCRYALDDPVESKLHLLRTPVVVARGARDPVVPEAWAREVTALLPHGRLLSVPGAGHAVHFSAPGALARVTLDLLPGRARDADAPR